MPACENRPTNATCEGYFRLERAYCSRCLKALALGARFVFIGRLWVWGLSIASETGIRHLMKALLAEFDILMNVSGYPKLEDINREALDSLPSVAIMPTDALVT